MHTPVLRALEFDRIVEVAQSFAVTPLGVSRLAGLHPQTDAQRVAQLLNITTEAVKYLQSDGAFSLTAPAEIEAVLLALAVEGRPLEAPRLVSFADFLESIDNTRTAIRRQTAAFPALAALVEPCASFKGQIAEVRRQISPSGEVVDGASPELRTIRDRLRKQRSRLRGTLESYLRGKETARYLQDQVVTERNGRLVLVVRAEHRSSIPGIIHGSSGSGASLYLEPLSTVEVNNEIVALEEQEAEEIRRILLSLTEAFRSRALDVQRTIEVATELDVLQAKARLAELVDGVEPAVASDGRVELRGARHPLLIPAVLARVGESDPSRKPPVPVDLLLIPPTRVLLITGPNTGGKTVALKTAGLLVLMAQAGLHIPAVIASLPVFRSVFADIGDEQSIAANLSTFSGHITNIASMDRSLVQPALVLLDELGAGTDPAEGGALGVAIIDNFRQRGAQVISTTHYDALKAYASTTEGVVCAAFGFDPETFEPTYKLVYGSPGRSLALEIAGRLGLSQGIVDAARSNLSAEQAQLAEHLARMDEELRALDHDRRLVKRERELLDEADHRARAREESLRHREESSKTRLNQALDEHLRAARSEIDAVLADLRRRTAELAAQAARHPGEQPTTGDTGATRSQARSAVEHVIDRFRPEAAERATAPTSPPGRSALVGDRVLVSAFGLEGTVVAVHDREAEVEVQGKRLRSRLSDLQVLEAVQPSGSGSRVRVDVHLQPRSDALSELNLVGSTVDDALTRVDKFLDESLLTEQRIIRLIHGYGTGQLRRAIATYLESHPLVAHFQPAPADQGGGGVTVVELKE
ncbi:MAG TPA: endonuclease MutS2 [Vicinamibacterales bacterium]